MAKGFNLWLCWEAYKMAHPEARQVLEWQEEYYKTLCGCSQNGKNQLSRSARKLKGGTTYADV